MAEYVYQKSKPKRRYHIKTPTGTKCKMENGGFLHKLDTISNKPPVGRQACQICSQHKLEEWEQEISW